ncbi:MAG: hypothetical protein CMJ40_08060 [Phycisphaerae bacterium]|nr:hypothetical protein [Phycisphaerae bacterium]|tara:strand:- start:5185 stop:7191 length:2007 start_codon:yes stop_codon:yes gene_type:complete
MNEPRNNTHGQRPDYASEWLLTNGIGGFAMGTPSGANTRRYHGLLVAAVNPPVDRVVCLNSTIDQFHPTAEEGRYFPLSTQLFGGSDVPHPNGWEYQVDFECDMKSATWTWVVDGGITIRKKLALEQGCNSCLLEWTIDGLVHDAMLTIRPLVTMRNFHELLASTPDDLQSSAEGTRCCVQRNGQAMIMESCSGDWESTCNWWDNFDYPKEMARGQDHTEHALCAGVLRVPISPESSTVRMKVSLQESLKPSPPSVDIHSDGDVVADRLADACRQFIVKRSHGDGAPASVIAGYPWFADWGRDSLISLPGLFLKQARANEAISMLGGFASRIRNGIIPNRFDDSQDKAYYNTADASLWFINAVHACHESLDDPGSSSDLMLLVQTCRQIVDSYRSGTDYGIRIDYDGLLMAGIPGEAVTWMDARVNGVGVTARIGKPVELSALWYNGLRCLAEMVADPAESAEYKAAAALTRKSFGRFWNEASNCCYDLLVPHQGNWRGDARIRPNQILAVSLRFPCLTGQQAKLVMDCARDHLLTPYGLRTLSPDDPDYKGRYEGDMTTRDESYHNGTVWPWLMGPYCDGLQAISEDATGTDELMRELLNPLVESMDDGCTGQIAEIYDGDKPHRAHGCPAQAWSVAEVARSWPADLREEAPGAECTGATSEESILS